MKLEDLLPVFIIVLLRFICLAIFIIKGNFLSSVDFHSVIGNVEFRITVCLVTFWPSVLQIDFVGPSW